MNFEVDRYSSAWAHIALCADLTWATEPPDEFIITNQRLWTQHYRISQVLQDTTVESSQNQCDLTASRTPANQENGNCFQKSVKDIIPESRLARYYGNFYYDEVRENCYKITGEKKSSGRFHTTQACEDSDLTECWMLPEVEYWFRKLIDDSSERMSLPRRRRQFRMPVEDDFERFGPCGATEAGEEALLEARVRSVRRIWEPHPRTTTQNPTHPKLPRAPSPPPQSRKMRARRRQPRRLSFTPPPVYCLDGPRLCCDPASKFQFDTPHPPHLTECQRALGRLSASVQAILRSNATRCPLYRGTNVSRYIPTGQRPLRCADRRYSIWWPRDQPSAKSNRVRPKGLSSNDNKTVKINTNVKTVDKVEVSSKMTLDHNSSPSKNHATDDGGNFNLPRQKGVIINDDQTASTSAALDVGLCKKRLYSTVLSTTAPSPIALTPTGCVRLSHKLTTPGLIKLNPKVILPTRMRPAEVKFEELEKEALEQYKASDESIDTKFRELEEQAVEQYSTSNSNTSCSSGNSTEKRTPRNPTIPEVNHKSQRKQMSKFHKDTSVDSVVIYSQNFPDLNAKCRPEIARNLKNCHNPPRGEKKECSRSSKSARNFKSDCQRAASDTDYEAKPTHKVNHKGPLRWTLHVMPPKKRHLNSCVSDFSSDEDIEEVSVSIRDARPCLKNRITGKVKLSAHGGGDLNPVMRKT